MSGVFRRRPRAALEIGIVALACALVAGAVVGSGLAQTVLETPDPLTWLRNARGQVTQVNPETGALVDRLQIGQDGDPLQVVQDGGTLAVTNLRTNEVTIVDLSLLQIVGVREGEPGGLKVLLSSGQIYLVHKALGQIERINPLTAQTIGEPWQADGQLADAVVDGGGALWALNQTGRLVSLRWPDAGASFAEQDRRDLAGTGADAVLVGHDRGATAIDPAGAATQVGTGQDRTQQAGGLAAPLAAADRSPAALVPVSSPGSRSVHLVREDGVVAVDGPPIGCRKPGKPAVYRGLVYTPCIGDRKVVVLDPAGRPAGPNLPTPAGGEPELVLNAGLLIVNVPGAPTGLVVKPDGSTQPIRTDDPAVEVRDPNARPTALPSGLGVRPPKVPPPPQDRGGQDPGRPPASRKPTGQAGTTPGPDPTGATPGGSEPVQSPGGPGPGPGEGGATPDPTASPPLDETVAPTDPVTDAPTTDAPITDAPTTEPPRVEDRTPTGVTAEARPDSTVQVSWVPAVIAPDSYRVLRTDTGEQVATQAAGATSAVVTVLTLGQPVSFVVEAVFADGGFPSAPSNTVTAFGRPGGPGITIELASRSPTSVTLRVYVDVVSDGFSPVTTYDLSVSTGSGRGLENVQGVPIGQRPYQFSADCSGANDVCLRGGSVTATATLYNAAGAGPPDARSAGIPAPPAFGFNQAFMYVSTGGKCLDFDLRLHTCTGSSGQLWTHVGDRAAIRNGNGGCLAVNDDLHLARDGCTDDPKKWTRINPNGNEALLFAPDGGECVRVIGDPAGEGVPVLDRKQCSDAPTERWTAWRQQDGVPMAAAQAAAFTVPAGPTRQDGPLGTTAVVLLLLPLAAGLVRRKRHGRPGP